MAGGNTSILKMLQISTVFPRNHKHAFACQQGSRHPTTLSCWTVLTAAWGGEQHLRGWGPVTQLGRGRPCGLGRLPGASTDSPGQ